MTNSTGRDLSILFLYAALHKIWLFETLFLSYNQFYSILRLSDVIPIFLFITSEMMADYYLFVEQLKT